MIIAIILLIIIILIFLGLRPFKLNSEVRSNPASSYEDAAVRIKAIQSEEAELGELNPVCGTRLLSHGEQVENVIVFLHGFTSCPDQFGQLGQEFFEKGYNVYIPRTPRHGIKDRLGNPLKGLTAEELAEFASRSADIAQGLGERVIVTGLSGGGSMTTWLSQERPDVDLAVPISPFVGIGFIPRILNRPLTNLVLRLPDFFQWWDPINKENNPNSAPYSYTRYPTHALFENMRLGFAAEEDAKRVKPAAGAILVITNANDGSINNDVVAEFEAMWREHGEQFLFSYQFPKELNLPHDLITVGRPDGNIELVYSKLHELIR
ncbi:MAG: alpha/beta fold hydrolase [Anaerolineales bacterium]